ncbi:MAG: SUF system Fe-S cluster assembly regulator [Gammaproteobacteria bacterium]
MLRITKLTDYAIVILSELAANYSERLSAAELAKNTGIHLPTVSKLLKVLQQQRLVISHLGAEGGYQLAFPAEQISLAQIIEALEGPIAMTQCNLQHGICEQEHICQVRPHWQRINKVILQTLNDVWLSEMVGEAV